MILAHPDHPKKKVIKYNHLLYQQLKAEGWINVTPQRTQAQKNQSLRWQQQGEAKRLAACLRSYINHKAYNPGMFTPEELTQLQYAVTILDRGASRI